jgi:DNA repair protein RadC
MGAEALSNAELLAILLRSGVEGLNVIQMAQKILIDLGGIGGLHRTPFEELTKVHGVGNAKAAQLKAAIELGRRLSIAEVGEKPAIHCPEDAASLVGYEMGALEQEHLRVMLLDTRNRVQKIAEVYKGSLNSSAIRIGEIFRDAIRINAAAIILLHNHPSGDPTPSPEDISVTKAIITAGELMNIEVLDHLVIGKNSFVSMKAKGLGF